MTKAPSPAASTYGEATAEGAHWKAFQSLNGETANAIVWKFGCGVDWSCRRELSIQYLSLLEFSRWGKFLYQLSRRSAGGTTLVATLVGVPALVISSTLLNVLV